MDTTAPSLETALNLPPGSFTKHLQQRDAEEQAECPLDAATGSVIRVRYRVDVQSVSGRWDNVEIRDDEAIARRDEAEWRSWLNENRKTWKDIRIVKETTTAEVLQNVKTVATEGAGESPTEAAQHPSQD
jgi:hypothetical protein